MVLSGTDYVLTGISLTSGASVTVVVTGVINSGASVGSTITNTASVEGTHPETATSNNTTSGSGVVQNFATDPYVTGTVSTTAGVSGTTVVYTIVYGNNGPDTATGVDVSWLIDAGLTIVSVSGATLSGNGVSLPNLTLTNGQSGVIIVTGVIA